MYWFLLTASLFFSPAAIYATEPSITLSPAKVEIRVEPGMIVTRNLTLTSELSTDVRVSISVEDIGASDNPAEALKLLGDRTGLYSIKKYIFFPNSLILKAGSTATIPVTISLPVGTPPGGLYGSVILSTNDKNSQGNIRLINRLASLFFVRVAGEIHEEGKLVSFSKSGDSFKILYENTGDMYLNSYGIIVIKNILGREVASREIDPWFVLPHSSRERTIEWKHGSLLGWYTAELYLNRGYGDIVDKAKISFWIFSWSRSLTALSVVILLGLVYVLWRNIKTKSYF